MSKTLNRKDIARLISQDTGFKIADIEKIMEREGDIIGQAVSQGYSVKNHKWWKLNVEKKKAKRAWNGLGNSYFDQPEKYVVKFVQLSLLKNAIDTYNTNNEEEDV